MIGEGASIGATRPYFQVRTLANMRSIGAGAVVTKPVKDFELVVGNPAVHAGWVNELGEKKDK